MPLEQNNDSDGINRQITSNTQHNFRVDPAVENSNASRIDGSLSQKIAAGGGIGLVVGAAASIRMWAGGLLPALITVLGATVVGSIAGGALFFKDYVEEKKSRGQKVGFLLNWIFGLGLGSMLLFWVPFIFLTVIVLTTILF